MSTQLLCQVFSLFPISILCPSKANWRVVSIQMWNIFLPPYFYLYFKPSIYLYSPLLKSHSQTLHIPQGLFICLSPSWKHSLLLQMWSLVSFCITLVVHIIFYLDSLHHQGLNCFSLKNKSFYLFYSYIPQNILKIYRKSINAHWISIKKLLCNSNWLF